MPWTDFPNSEFVGIHMYVFRERRSWKMVTARAVSQFGSVNGINKILSIVSEWSSTSVLNMLRFVLIRISRRMSKAISSGFFALSSNWQVYVTSSFADLEFGGSNGRERGYV